MRAQPVPAHRCRGGEDEAGFARVEVQIEAVVAPVIDPTAAHRDQAGKIEVAAQAARRQVAVGKAGGDGVQLDEAAEADLGVADGKAGGALGIDVGGHLADGFAHLRHLLLLLDHLLLLVDDALGLLQQFDFLAFQLAAVVFQPLQDAFQQAFQTGHPVFQIAPVLGGRRSGTDQRGGRH